MTRLRLLAIVSLAIIAAHCMKSLAPAESLECRMEAVHPLVAGGPVALRFRLVNRTDGPLWVLRWNTPVEGWRGTLFTVTFQGIELPYQGPRVKRGDPGPEAYVGQYQVKVTGALLDVASAAAAVPRPRDQQQPMALKCEPLTLDVKKAAS
jgi:hypothetical protein